MVKPTLAQACTRQVDSTSDPFLICELTNPLADLVRIDSLAMRFESALPVVGVTTDKVKAITATRIDLIS
jgi:hypothetical protein